MKNLPTRIYLQVDPDDMESASLELGGEESDFKDINDGGVTWCTDRINDSDVPYILESNFKEALKKAFKAGERLEASFEFGGNHIRFEEWYEQNKDKL